MKRFLLVGLLVCIVQSCGTLKIPEGETTYETPCSGDEYTSNNKFYRASAQAVSNSSSGATKAARRKAEAELISDIKNTITLVSDLYESNIESGDVGEYNSLALDFSRKIASGSLKNLSVICQKTTKVSSTGMYKHYISIEMSAKDVVDDFVASLGESKKNSIRSNSEKMRAIFDEVTRN